MGVYFPLWLGRMMFGSDPCIVPHPDAMVVSPEHCPICPLPYHLLPSEQWVLGAGQGAPWFGFGGFGYVAVGW